MFHNDIRGRFDRGEQEVVEAMRRLGRPDRRRCATTCSLAAAGREIGALLDAQLRPAPRDLPDQRGQPPHGRDGPLASAPPPSSPAPAARSSAPTTDEEMFEALARASRHSASRSSSPRSCRMSCRSSRRIRTTTTPCHSQPQLSTMLSHDRPQSRHPRRRIRHPLPARHQVAAQGDAADRRHADDPVRGRGGVRLRASPTS